MEAPVVSPLCSSVRRKEGAARGRFNMPIDCSSLIPLLRNDFGALWHCRAVGNSLEISTPYALPDNSALAIYVTEREGRIIVSDGGYLRAILAEECSYDDEKSESIIYALCDHHGIKIHEQKDGRVFYFKETNTLELVPSLIFDLGNFAVAVSNALRIVIPQTKQERSRFVPL